ncbi:MAG: hypothetical protein Fur0041_18420 [Bacteroidia bacterium]
MICPSVHAQSVKSLEAVRAKTVPKIDGLGTDSCWANVPEAIDFTQIQPNPGLPAGQKTSVKVLFDDGAIYVFARMYDTAPDSILKQLGPRDEYTNNTDAFGVMFDTYHDRRNAFWFVVTAAGVQTDARYTFDKTDVSLNALWFSKTHQDSLGWTVEMKIPYQTLRFPNEQEMLWGINFMRNTRRYRETAWWNTVDPAVAGIVNQAGDLTGVAHIHSPVRLALLPYVSGYIENYDGSNAYSLNGGMDIKYGINESFTLDMTLIPDFGQAISDNLVLNLSPFEVKFDERRYFFTEGTELFNKNDLFYSRRIGARPSGYSAVNSVLQPGESIYENPAVTRLYNSVKISGRMPSKLGFGFLNAVTAPAYAIIRNNDDGSYREVETEPLANYNVIVVDQILKRNSYIGFLNTNVVRNGSARDANVSSVQYRLSDKKNKWAAEGYGDMSLIFNPANTAAQDGYRYFVKAGKVSGRYLIDLSHTLVSNTFDPTDLGYLDRNNYLNFNLHQAYNIYKPFKRFINMFNDVNISQGMMYVPRRTTFFTVTGKHIVTFRNFLTVGANWLMNPMKSNDYFETRTPGRYLIYPKNYELGGFISSDYRKKFALDLSSSYRIFMERNRMIFKYAVSPRWRVNDKLFIVYRWENERKKDNVGFVRKINDDIVFGVRDLNTVTSTLTTNYIFTNRMSLLLRVRHYWSEVKYSKYYKLNDNGMIEEKDYNINADVNFNAFNIDMIFTWQFLPGSELNIVWKNAIITSSSVLAETYLNDLNMIFGDPQSNSISAKLIWYIDAGTYLTERRNRSM